MCTPYTVGNFPLGGTCQSSSSALCCHSPLFAEIKGGVPLSPLISFLSSITVVGICWSYVRKIFALFIFVDCYLLVHCCYWWIKIFVQREKIFSAPYFFQLHMRNDLVIGLQALFFKLMFESDLHSSCLTCLDESHI